VPSLCSDSATPYPLWIDPDLSSAADVKSSGPLAVEFCPLLPRPRVTKRHGANGDRKS
jgi:hypothetical protein